MNNDQKMKDIERQIAEDFKAFNEEIYSGESTKGIIEIYKKSVMANAPAVHKLPTTLIKGIVAKKEAELNNLDIAYIVNLVSATPPKELYTTVLQALKEMERFDDLRMDYNIKVKKKESELNERKATLISLAGVDIATPKLYTA